LAVESPAATTTLFKMVSKFFIILIVIGLAAAQPVGQQGLLFLIKMAII